jgi:hypothetical protein
MKKLLTRGMLSGIVASTALLATACPPPASSTPVTWTFKATQVTVNDSQDEVRDPIFGTCINFIGGCSDEPYIINVNFRTKIGVPNSTQTFISGGRGNGPGGVGAGSTVALTGAQQSTATFSNVIGLDVLDLADSNNHLEVLGTYSFVLEEDEIGVGSAATGTAAVLKDALNATLAAGTLPSDASLILDLILDNIGSAFGIVAGNLPTFGLGDDVMGGGMFIGIAAKGGLADIINSSIASTPFPSISIPVVELPPDITRGGFYTLSGSKSFNGLSWGAHGGTHTYNFTAAKA